MGLDLDSEVMRRDVYPAELLLPDGDLLTGVRVFVTNRRILAYKRVENRIVLVREVELADDIPGDRGTLMAGHRLELTLFDGTKAFVNRGKGCGCGSPLKALAPPVGWTR